MPITIYDDLIKCLRLSELKRKSQKYSVYYNARPRKVANFHIWRPGIITFLEFLLEK